MIHDERVQFRLVSLYCLICGHQTANVRLPIAGLTPAVLRAVLAAEAPETQPRWNAKLEPRCSAPRCPGRMILDIRPIRVRLDNDVPAERCPRTRAARLRVIPRQVVDPKKRQGVLLLNKMGNSTGARNSMKDAEHYQKHGDRS